MHRKNYLEGFLQFGTAIGFMLILTGCTPPAPTPAPLPTRPPTQTPLPRPTHFSSTEQSTLLIGDVVLFAVPVNPIVTATQISTATPSMTVVATPLPPSPVFVSTATRTSTVRPRIAPTSTNVQACVTPIRTINVRGGPGTSFRVLGTVAFNTVLPIIRQQGEWYNVELPDGETGWVSQNVVVIAKCIP